MDPLELQWIHWSSGAIFFENFQLHFQLLKSEWLRRLTPNELELLNMFPPGHTEGSSDSKRAFFMGNALVVGIVQKLAEVLAER